MRPPESSTELTQAQCEQLEQRAFESLRFLRKLLSRIEQCKFPVDDKLRRDVEAAYSAVLGPRMTLRYLACMRERPLALLAPLFLKRLPLVPLHPSAVVHDGPLVFRRLVRPRPVRVPLGLRDVLRKFRCWPSSSASVE